MMITYAERVHHFECFHGPDAQDAVNAWIAAHEGIIYRRADGTLMLTFTLGMTPQGDPMIGVFAVMAHHE